MGEFTNSKLSNILGFAALVLMLAAIVTLLVISN
jgi:hypothetical protein